MTARQQRRHEERLASKQAHKAQKQSAAAQPALAEPLDWSPEPAGFEPQPPTRALINRQNAQHSTGPRTPEGKAVSSMNRFRHGLAGQFVLLDWEDGDLYDELLILLQDEHQPETITEHLLVERMAQHQWLSQRAVRLQRYCFHDKVPLCQEEKLLALYIRYGTTHDRAFHKCLADLMKLRAQKAKQQAGFESQKRQQAAETRKQELHEAKLSAINAKKPANQPPIPVSAAPEATPRQAPDGFDSQIHENLAPEHVAKAA